MFAEFERAAIGERTSGALTHKRRNRQVYCGSVPFGYERVDDLLVEVRAEQDALTEIKRLDLAGASYRAIGRMLTERGVMPHRAATWHAETVRNVLRSRIANEAISSA